MMDRDNIFGCFVSVVRGTWEDEQSTKENNAEKGQLFREYIWGLEGICDDLKNLKKYDYGDGFDLILFQFYVNPISAQLNDMKKIEGYRKKEKSIGVCIFINNENFFSKADDERRCFLKSEILNRVDLVCELAKKKKLNLDTNKLLNDLEVVLRKQHAWGQVFHFESK
jgi:hypothetical protein